jgi:hypothetical protein
MDGPADSPRGRVRAFPRMNAERFQLPGFVDGVPHVLPSPHVV